MRSRLAALLHPAIAAAGVIGLALPPCVAAAQGDPSPSQDVRPNGNPGASQGAGPAEKPASDAAAAKPASVGGVIVEAPRPEARPPIPADKRAAFDQEVAKSEAWKRYRKSIPPSTTGTLEQADDYPGLNSLLPPP